MKHKKYLPKLLSSASLALMGTGALLANSQPNIVVIIADDLGTNELGCYGGVNLQTPNIDKLATDGIRLTNNYASCAMSVPIRASLYTGLYPARHGSYQNHKASYSNLKSSAHYLSDLGYRVGRTGKDHPVNQPKVYAFEKVPGFTVDCVSSTAPYTTDGIKEFIERDDEPFCLYVCSIHPHVPWTWGDANKFNPNDVVLPPNCVDNQKTREDFCKYLAEIKALDDEVGDVMSVLENAGKLDNTLVVFLGEQGPQMPFGKWTCYRYGQNSAFIARYPEKIANNTVSDVLVQYEDILPTMIEFAGGNPIENLDGKSCLQALYGNDVEHREWAYGIHNNFPEGTYYPIRSIQDKRYKLIVNLTPEAEYYEKHMMVLNGTNMWSSWIQTATTDEHAAFLTNRFVNRPAIEFYDLEQDKWELNNLADLPEHAERIALMQSALEDWMEQQGDRGILMDVSDPENPNDKTPIPISNLEDINNYMRNDLSGNYYLTNDIIIPDGVEWIPIGAADEHDTDPERFRGVFDGKGYGIYNLTIAQANNFKGLFGRIDHAELKNFDLVDVNIKGKAPTGGVSGAMIGASKIERVSVTGVIHGDTEIAGIVGRIARDPTHTDYNIIHDCYVSADIKATSLSTNMNTPSCAGGIAAFSHSIDGASVSKVDIRRVYVDGSIISEQKNHVAGNASGILTFYDNHKLIKMEEVIVLCDTIGSATSNLFFSRRGPRYDEFELFDKVYARTGITLNYLNSNDRGRGGEIPDGVIQYNVKDVYKTKQFYEQNLSWDFNEVWTITEGKLPVLKRDKNISSLSVNKQEADVSLVSKQYGVDIFLPQKYNACIYNIAGENVFASTWVEGDISINLQKGMYILTLKNETDLYAKQFLVH